MLKFASLLFLFLSFNAISSDECTNSYDKLSIPHIKTTNENFYYCFGYFHGKDRAWQMDYFRRAAYGTNAELYGYTMIKADIVMRLLDLKGKATELWENFPTDKKTILESYTEGVNKGFEIGKDQKEFKDLGVELQKWTPIDSLVVLLLQSFDQTRKTFFKDYQEQVKLETWKDKAARLFDEDGVPWESTILKDGEYEKRSDAIKTTKASQSKFFAPKLLYPIPTVFGIESGSNNWVVAKSNSKTGNALFANDPHLELKTPLFWYWINIQTEDNNLIGASLPGAPIVVSGTNGKVAWGLTNAYINTADAYFLKDEDKISFTKIRPVVWFKLGFLKLPFFFKSFEKIERYPILPLELETDKKMVLKWSGFDITPQDLLGMFDLKTISNVSDADATFKKIGLPSWNFVFADTNGDIGYRVVGKVIKLTEKDPFGIETKSLEQINNISYLMPDERPHVLKPKRGYILTANHRHFPADSKIYGGRGYSYSFRGLRLDELIKGKKHDVASFKTIQCDTYATDAKFFLPKLIPLLEKISLDKKVSKEIQELKDWNLFTSDNSFATAIYRRFMDISMEKLDVNETAFIRLLDELSEKEVKIIQDSFLLALKEINNKRWGDLHRLEFPHLSKNSDWDFSPHLAGPGDNHTVTPGTSTWNEERSLYEHHNGASMRLIIEMKKKPEIYLALPGVNKDYQKADPFLFNDWNKCQYQKLEY